MVKLSEFRPPYSKPELLAGVLGVDIGLTVAGLLCLALVVYRGETPFSGTETVLLITVGLFCAALTRSLIRAYAEAANNRAWNEFVLQVEQLEIDQKLDPESRLRLEMIRHQKPGEYLYFGPMPAPTEESHAARTHQNAH